MRVCVVCTHHQLAVVVFGNESLFYEAFSPLFSLVHARTRQIAIPDSLVIEIILFLFVCVSYSPGERYCYPIWMRLWCGAGLPNGLHHRRRRKANTSLAFVTIRSEWLLSLLYRMHGKACNLPQFQWCVTCSSTTKLNSALVFFVVRHVQRTFARLFVRSA